MPSGHSLCVLRRISPWQASLACLLQKWDCWPLHFHAIRSLWFPVLSDSKTCPAGCSSESDDKPLIPAADFFRAILNSVFPWCRTDVRHPFHETPSVDNLPLWLCKIQANPARHLLFPSCCQRAAEVYRHYLHASTDSEIQLSNMAAQRPYLACLLHNALSRSPVLDLRSLY